MEKHKVGMTFGVFDVFHKGHKNLIDNARERCNRLIVCVSSSEYCFKKKGHIPMQDYERRKTMINKIAKIPFEDIEIQREIESKKDLIDRYKPDVLFVGDDWNKNTYTGEGLGIPVVYLPYTEDISSTKIRNNREGARRDLEDIKKVLDKLGIPFFLLSGTMLGAIRDGDIIEWDDDIDLGSLSFPEGIDQIYLTDRLQSKGFRVNPQMSENSGRFLITRNTLTGLHFFREDGDRAMCEIWESPLLTIPMKFFKETGEEKIGEKKYGVLNKEYLEWMYKDWRTPTKKNYFRKNYRYVQ